MPLKTLIKIAVAGLILYVIAGRVDFAAAFELMRSADPLWLLAALGASLLIIVADAAYWSQSMTPAGLTMRFRTAMLFGIVGWFFVNIAPSTVGADLFRVAQMRAAGATTARSIRLVAAARLMSFAALIAVIGLGLPYVVNALEAPRDRLALAAVFAAALAAFAGLVVGGPLIARAPARLRRGPLAFAAELSGDVRMLLTKTTPGGWFFLTVQHFLRAGAVLCIGAALGLAFDPIALLALLPAAFLVAMVPISFGAWGVREASFVYFLGAAGIAAPAALAMSIIFGLTRVVIGAAGGLIWVLTRAEHFTIAVDADKAPAEDDVRTTA